MEAEEIKDESAIITKAKKEIHMEAVKRMDIITSAEKEDRDKGVRETRFVNVRGAQWEDFAVKARKGRPKREYNYIGKGLDTLIGDQRQTEIGPKVTPVGMGADDKTAGLYRGLIRNIEKSSRAQRAYDQSCSEAYTSRYGGFRYVMKWNEADPFVQDICIKGIDSAVTSMFYDPSAKEYDKSDAMYLFLVTNLHTDDYDAKYPDTVKSDFQIDNYEPRYNGCFEWYSHNNIIVAEYFRKVPVKKTVVKMSDGTIIEVEKYDIIGDELAAAGIIEIDRKEIDAYDIERYVVNGTEVIEDKEIWPGMYYPVVPQFGKETKIGAHTYRKSITTDAMDPQRDANYAGSTNIEVLALAPKDKIIVTPKQIKGFNEWSTLSTSNNPILRINHDAKRPGPVERLGPPAVQTGLIELIRESKSNVYAMTGAVPTQQQGVMGEDIDTRSWKTQREQNIRSDSGVYIYYDNYLSSREYGYVVLLDLIPRIYDTERQVRIIRKDGSEEIETINKTIKDVQTNKDVIVNDLSQGKYQVEITQGKLYATQKIEAAEKMEALIEKSPVIADIGLDLLIKTMDMPGADELHERVRKQMIVAGKIDPTDDEKKEFGEDLNKGPSEAEIAQLEDLKATTWLKDSQSIELRANAKKTLNVVEKDKSITYQNVTDAYNKLVETNQLKEEQGIPITLEDQMNLRVAARLVEDSQEDILRQPNEQAQPVQQPVQQQVPPMVDNQAPII